MKYKDALLLFENFIGDWCDLGYLPKEDLFVLFQKIWPYVREDAIREAETSACQRTPGEPSPSHEE